MDGPVIDLAAMGFGPKESPPELPGDTARHVLTDAFALFRERETLEPGNLVSYKVGVDPGYYPFRSGVAVFIEYINPAHETTIEVERVNAGQPAILAMADCIVGTLNDTGAMSLRWSCSRALQIAPDYVPEPVEVKPEAEAEAAEA